MAIFKWTIGESVIEEQFDEAKLFNQRYAHIDDKRELSFPRYDAYHKPVAKKCNGKEKSQISDLEELPSIGECIFGFHTMALVAEAVKNQDLKIKESVEVVLSPAFQFVNATKELLIKMEKSLSIKFASEKTISLAKQASDFIDACRTSISRYRGFNKEAIYDEYPLVFDSKSIIRKIAEELVEYVVAAQKERKRNQPYRLYEKLAVSILPDITVERRKLIQQIAYAYKYHPSNNGPYSCQLILDDVKYSSYIAQRKADVINKCDEVGSPYLNMKSIKDPLFADVVNAMKKCIERAYTSGNSGKKPPFYDYIGDNGIRNFSVFDCGSDRYISFSGSFDTSTEKIVKYFNTNPSLWIALEKNIRKYIRKDPLLTLAKYVGLNLDVYTNNPPPETLNEAIEHNRQPDRREFSCCERKLIARVPPMPYKRCYLFTRHKPCPNCRKSISTYYKMSKVLEIYYLNKDSKQLHKDKKVHKYRIR